MGFEHFSFLLPVTLSQKLGWSVCALQTQTVLLLAVLRAWEVNRCFCLSQLSHVSSTLASSFFIFLIWCGTQAGKRNAISWASPQPPTINGKLGENVFVLCVSSLGQISESVRGGIGHERGFVFNIIGQMLDVCWVRSQGEGLGEEKRK